MDEYLLRPLLAGLALAFATGPFGCFVVWRRMAYFGDTLAHGALLGLVVGALLDLAPLWGVLGFCGLAAVIVAWAQAHARLGSDTILGIMAHSALALGLVLLALAGIQPGSLMAWLLGDILAVDWADVTIAWVGGGVVVALLALIWPDCLAISLDADLAQVEGRPVARTRLQLMLLMALVVAAAMKLVGALLVTAFLIIPAAAARPFVRSPEAMAVGAVLAGWLAVAGGLAASWHFDTPTGPSMVVAGLLLFVLSRVKRP